MARRWATAQWRNPGTLDWMDVTFPSRSTSLHGYLAMPDGAGRHPGVVVIHEAYGLNDNIRDIAGRFATEGYAALAVDLFAGRSRAICMGGGLAIAWAPREPRLRAIAPFYGTNPRPLEDVQRMCPVVGSYPGNDFTARSGRKLDTHLTHIGVEHDIKVYPGARHSFFNDQGRAFDASASADAWQRTLDFFAEHVRPQQPA